MWSHTTNGVEENFRTFRSFSSIDGGAIPCGAAAHPFDSAPQRPTRQLDGSAVHVRNHQSRQPVDNAVEVKVAAVCFPDCL